MTGPEDVAETIRAHLAAAVPVRLAAIRAVVAADEATLPDPALVAAQERDLLNLGEWPAIFVVVQRLARLRRIDGPNDDGTMDYLADYPVRVFMFLRAAGYVEVDTLRKRYARAVREALFTAQDTTRIDEASYVESYSDVGVDDAKRSIAGAWAEVTVSVVETMPAPLPAIPAPDPDGWDLVVDVEALPHPALD